jgi:hypothetical protein
MGQRAGWVRPGAEGGWTRPGVEAGAEARPGLVQRLLKARSLKGAEARGAC